MKVSPAKENILKRIRNALSQPVPLPFPQSEGNSSVFMPPPKDLDVHFAETFVQLNGKFVFCEDLAQFRQLFTNLCKQQDWKQIWCPEKATLHALLAGIDPQIVFLSQIPLEQIEVSLTTCECLVARTGSVVLTTGQRAGRTASVYAPTHVVVASVNQLVWDIRDALHVLKERYDNSWPSVCTFHTGPSRTSDIEKTLVMGAHGPKDLYVFLIDQPLP
ncbi:MAG: lactate utilization protein [Thermoflavifilum sp.]|nr:lactate utilization protein [Thermoflavifilum sp.]